MFGPISGPEGKTRRQGLELTRYQFVARPHQTRL